MKKTYITTVPDRIGAFLKASRCFAELGINITRVSYNKAIDTHTLFIDAKGTPEQLRLADRRLSEIGYLHNEKHGSSIVLLAFYLRDVPAGVTEVLTLINSFHLNISYISYQRSGTEPPLFKVGLYVEAPEKLRAFITEAEKLCRVGVIDYDRTEKTFDNSLFYESFIHGITRNIPLSEPMKEQLLVNTNLAMQRLDEQGTAPYRTFDSIARCAELLAAGRGEGFVPRVTRHPLSENTTLLLIEPPCGSNIAVLISGEETLFVDTGLACYREEMEALLRKELPRYDRMRKTALITHADVDHCGLLPLFDEVLASRKSADCLRAEYEGRKSYREQNPLHTPYIRICRLLTAYRPPYPDKVRVMWGDARPQTAPLTQVGFFSFGDLHFEVYEGQGGHLPGEIVLIDYAHRIAFTGDIYINLQEQTDRQAAYNRCAPTLMTSVDTDPRLCTAERQAILQRLGAGNWQIFGAHGYKKDYTVRLADDH